MQSNSITPSPNGKPADTRLTPAQKPDKPSDDFPLFPHATRRWAKKINGRLHYFGPWDDPQGALQRYLDEKDALHSGRRPGDDPADCTVKMAVNAFLNAKAAARDAGEIAPRTWLDYKEATDCVITKFGKHRLVADLTPADFALLRKSLAKRWGPTRLSNVIVRIRAIFAHADANGLILRKPVYGTHFKRPSKKTIRVERATKGKNFFTSDEIKTILDAANPQLKAMILLGLNGGMGNADCGQLPLDAVDLDRAFIDFPRVKTAIPRRFPLWPETIEAIRQAIEDRPAPKNPDHDGLVFITKYGGSWYKQTPDSPVAQEMIKLLKTLGIHRKGLGFYTCRHVFRTLADETLDRPAIDLIMGHADPSMAGHYREYVSDDRLRLVVNHVHGKIFGVKPKALSTENRQ